MQIKCVFTIFTKIVFRPVVGGWSPKKGRLGGFMIACLGF